jgi:hypothetical protein
MATVMAGWLILAGCPGPAADPPKKETSQQAPENAKDEPIAIADGSARLLFKSRAVELERIAPQYGCCLAAPAVKGEKEIQVFAPQSADGMGELVKSKTVKLGAGDVVEMYLDRRGENGWVPMATAKNPLPQLILMRRDLSGPLESAHVPEVEAFKESGRWGWIFLSEVRPQDAPKLTTNAGFTSATGFRREYELGVKGKVRLGKLVIQRMGGSEETVELGSGCSVVQICAGPDCAKKIPSPCAL